MVTLLRIMMLALLLLVPAHRLVASPNADPSGHWDGTVEAPHGAVTVEIDLARTARGLVGTIGTPAQGESGLPLVSVAVAGKAVTLVVAGTSDGGTFRGELADDGRAMSGDFVVARGGMAIPFHLKRTGDAKIAPPPRSASITRQLEGSWSGALTVEGKSLAIALTMANHPDGTATGTVATGGLQLPVAVTQKASHVRIDVPSVKGAYDGTLNQAGTELVGTWTQRSMTLPLTFRRSAR